MQCGEFSYLDKSISAWRLIVSSADIQFSTFSCAEETEVNKPDVSRNIYYSISINSCNISLKTAGFLMGTSHLLKHVHQPSCVQWKNGFWCLDKLFSINTTINTFLNQHCNCNTAIQRGILELCEFIQNY